MAPPRKSLLQARLSGAYARNPSRYNARTEPQVAAPLGEPPEWLTPPQADAWVDMGARMPWLNRSHRGITGIAAILQAKLAAGVLGFPGMNLLRMTLGQLGATPVSAHHAVVVEPEIDDLAEEHFR